MSTKIIREVILLSVVERMKMVTDGLKQPEIVKLMGEKRPHRVNSIFSGKQKVPEDFLIRFIEVFKVDANWLLLGVEEAPKPELSSVEAALLDNFRHCPAEEQDAIVRTSALLAKPQAKKVKKAG
jgi:hypothetical protein